MTKSQGAVITATAAAMILSGCHDVNSPLARSLQPPVTVLKTVGPPDQSFTVPADRGFPPTKTFLIQFPWDTWVTLEATGNVGFTRQAPIPGASANYTALYPAPPVGVTGIVDPYGDPCVMNLIPGDGVNNLPSFGNCGAAPKVDTVLSQKNLIPYIMRGPLPSKHYYNCSNYTDVCDAINAGSSTVRERPVPVAPKLKAVPHTIDTLHLAAVQFTGSITPDSITVQGAKFPHPYHVTLWEWIGADMTRDPLASSPTKVGCTNTLLCRYTSPEAGKMVLKVFVGGFEQTATASVQCLASPGDSALNDSTNDFALRSVLQQALEHADTGAAPGTGYDPQLKRGLRHETGGIVWRLPNGAGFMAVEYDDPHATQCNYHAPHNPTPPVPGATIESYFHTHSTSPGEDYYGCFDSVEVNNRWVKQPRYVGDPDATPGVPHTVGPDVGGGSIDDWANVQAGKAEYVMHKSGYAAKLAELIVPADNPNIWNVNAGKCTWVK